MSAPLVNLITKSSLIGVVPQFSANIADNDFVAANDFANKRLKKLIPAALWTRLTEIYSLSTWSNSTAYVTGNEVVLNSRGYKALQNGTNKNPATETDYWQEIEIYSVFRDYLKPFLCWQAYNHFLIYHGLFVSQGGIRKHIDMNAEEAPAEERSRAIKRAQETADLLYMDFQKYMEDVSNTIDTVVYSFTDTATFKPRIGIHIIKTIILFLLASNLSAQGYPLPIVNEARNYHFTKTVYIDGRLKVGYPTPTIARDIHFVSDTLRFEGLDGTGSILGIDVNGDVTRVTGAGDGGITGLTPSEVLFGGADGTIAQMPEFYWHPTNQTLLIQGLDNKKSLDLPGTTSQGINIGNQGIYSSDEFGIYDNDISDPLFLWLPTPNQIRIGYANGINYDRDNNRIGLGTSTLTQDLNIAADTILLSTIDGTGTFLKIDGSGNVTKGTEVGLGTVTSFSFTDGSGFDGTVTNSTTTPTLALTTTVGDNRVMYSNGGALAGSSLFTYDDAADAEVLQAVVADLSILGTLNYPSGLFNVNDGGSGFLGDFNGDLNSTYIYFEDPSELIQFRGDFIRFIDFASSGDRLMYTDNDGDLSAATLTPNDFNFSGGTLSIDYTNGQTASTSTKGFLTDTDWDTFNNKVGLVHSSELTAQTASIGATTVYTTPASDGYYRVSVTATVTTAAGSTMDLAIQLRYTEATDNNVKTFPTANVNNMNRTQTNTTGATVAITSVCHVKASTDIKFLTSWSPTGGSPQYNVHVTVEKL